MRKGNNLNINCFLQEILGINDPILICQKNDVDILIR